MGGGVSNQVCAQGAQSYSLALNAISNYQYFFFIDSSLVFLRRLFLENSRQGPGKIQLLDKLVMDKAANLSIIRKKSPQKEIIKILDA